jgi:tagatose 1,6-diphosphate aldolase GatY/KbaY
MSIVNAKEIMVEALKGRYAVGAFNITDLLQFEAVIDAAIETKSPVIVQTSVKPSQFLGTNMMVAIYRQLAESAPVPVCLHLDHCTEVEYCKKCRCGLHQHYDRRIQTVLRREYSPNQGSGGLLP